MPAPFPALLLAAAMLAEAGCPPAPGPVDARPPAAPETAQSEMVMMLNIPAFRLDVFGPGGRVASFGVAPGSPRYRTPRGRFAVTRVEMNPWWHPPPSAWARDDTITPPGPRNPMGRAKLAFGHLLFLHGTPQEASIGTAASHGCVRMRNDDVLVLARLVLATVRPDVPDTEIDALVENHRRTRSYTLRPPVPLTIVYRVAEVRDGVLELHPDVYGLEPGALRTRAAEALALAGVDTTTMERPLLDSLARAGRRAHASLPVAVLTAEAPPPGGRLPPLLPAPRPEYRPLPVPER